jgi:predicted nucleotide-binding protein
MLEKCNIGFLIMTAEDETVSGDMRARENVVHEAGLFQGRYGFERAIIVRENQCAGFSNVHGIVQILYESGHIESALYKIRDVISREFRKRD